MWPHVAKITSDVTWTTGSQMCPSCVALTPALKAITCLWSDQSGQMLLPGLTRLCWLFLSSGEHFIVLLNEMKKKPQLSQQLFLPWTLYLSCQCYINSYICHSIMYIYNYRSFSCVNVPAWTSISKSAVFARNRLWDCFFFFSLTKLVINHPDDVTPRACTDSFCMMDDWHLMITWGDRCFWSPG